MKFYEGSWEPREGVKTIFPRRIYEHRTDGDTLVVHTINNDGGKIGGLFITVRISSPAPGVVRVQASHFEGAPDPVPSFPVAPPQSGYGPVVREEEESVLFEAGDLQVRLNKNPWRMDFVCQGKILTSSGENSLGRIAVRGEGSFMVERLLLGVGECVYGLGERFGPFVKNGQSIAMWNDDAGTWTDLCYKNIPFYMTSKGYGVLVNSPGKVEFEIATEKAEQIQFSMPGEAVDYYIFAGPDPKQVLDRYTALLGRPALPPAWSFGLWLTTSFVTEYNEAIVTHHVDEMLARGIPLKVFHFDCSWMKDYHWCDFLWDERAFPDAAGMLQRLKAKGLKICVWINPYISQLSPMFAEGKAAGYFLKNADGSVSQDDHWQPGAAFVDFTNPAAVAWYQAKLKQLLDMGVDTFKTDFGEAIPADAVYHDGSDPLLAHNFYTLLYNKAVFELLESTFGKNQALVFARSATAGSQQYPVHWGGDTKATYESMAEEFRGGLSFAMSGAAFWSHDIGGFAGKATPALYKRWVAWGLLSSHSRLHGMETYRVPWLFDEESVDVLREFAKLKNRLMPYVFGCAVDAHRVGVPVMRPMPLEFPDDPACRYLDSQYMLGPSLLVAPVFNEEGVAEYYLPTGRWTDYFTGEVVEGGRWFKRKVDFMTIPLFVRPNTVLPFGATGADPAYDYASDLTLKFYEVPDGASHTVDIPATDGSLAARLECSVANGKPSVRPVEGKATWKVG
jgi:alpha-D-xyloside xylohydrolase